MRIMCELFGCRLGRVSACERCGSHLYYGDFVQRGLLPWLHVPSLRLYWFFFRPRCEICGRRVSRWKRNEYLCGRQECFDTWIPF
jgi:hypothetical protein